MAPGEPFFRSLFVDADRVAGDYTATIGAVRALQDEPLALHPQVTFLVGDNGSGKSTLVEAIAIAAKLNPEGGSVRTRFVTRASHSDLHRALTLERGPASPVNGFFLRAESFFNLATVVESGDPRTRIEDVYERALHEQSHGESFLAVALERFGANGFYVLDEPEAALSLQGQLALMRRIHQLVHRHCQFVIATHSPILLGYPDARIYELAPDGIEQRAYEETDQFVLTRAFLESRERFLAHLFVDDE